MQSVCRAVVILSLVMVFCWSSASDAAGTITIVFRGTPVVLNIAGANEAMLTRRCGTLAPGNTSLEDCTRILIVDMFRGYHVQSVGQDHVDACVAFKALADVEQAKIITQLSGVSPCP